MGAEMASALHTDFVTNLDRQERNAQDTRDG
jgi:hypothetical protein